MYRIWRYSSYYMRNEVFFIDNIMDMEQVYNQIISGNIDIVNDLSIDDAKIIIRKLITALKNERELSMSIADVHINLLNKIYEERIRMLQEQEEEEKWKRRQSEMSFLY